MSKPLKNAYAPSWTGKYHPKGEVHKNTPKITVYELLNDGYEIKAFTRKVDSNFSHKVFRVELTRNNQTSLTEFTVADELDRVLFQTKTNLDKLLGEAYGADKKPW